MKWAIIILICLSVVLVACAQGSNTAGEAFTRRSAVKLSLNGEVRNLKVGETFSIPAPDQTEVKYELAPVFISDGTVKTLFNGWMTPSLKQGETIITPEGIELVPVYITKSTAKYIVQGKATPELKINETYEGNAIISGVCEATVLYIVR